MKTSNLRDTVTVLPKVQGGAGLTLVVTYLPLSALISGEATESMKLLTADWLAEGFTAAYRAA